LWDSLKSRFNQFLAFAASKQVTEALLQRHEPIQTVDLSSDETETSAGAAFGGETSRTSRFTTQFPSRAFEFKKPSAFVDLSDDDDSDDFFQVAPASSTIIQSKKNDAVRRSTDLRREESTFAVPDVKPVNSLAEKQQTRDCLKSNILDLLYRKHKENRQKNDSQINDVSKT
jgi:hypothetical protein